MSAVITLSFLGQTEAALNFYQEVLDAIQRMPRQVISKIRE